MNKVALRKTGHQFCWEGTDSYQEALKLNGVKRKELDKFHFKIECNVLSHYLSVWVDEKVRYIMYPGDYFLWFDEDDFEIVSGKCFEDLFFYNEDNRYISKKYEGFLIEKEYYGNVSEVSLRDIGVKVLYFRDQEGRGQKQFFSETKDGVDWVTLQKNSNQVILKVSENEKTPYYKVWDKEKFIRRFELI